MMDRLWALEWDDDIKAVCGAFGVEEGRKAAAERASSLRSLTVRATPQDAADKEDARASDV